MQHGETARPDPGEPVQPREINTAGVPVAEAETSDPRHRPDFSRTRTLLMLAGVFNIVVGVAWGIAGIFFCFPLASAAILITLGVFELMLFSVLETPRLKEEDRVRRIRRFAIFDVCTIVLGNIPSAIVGALQLAKPRLEDER